jgi:hypothetical protein
VKDPEFSLFDRFVHAVLNRLFPRRDIVIKDRLYLRRWFIKGWGTDSQWFIHNIRLPDEGRDMHDHPWDFTSWVLLGGYTEEVRRVEGTLSYVETRCHSAGDKIENSAYHTHRIEFLERSVLGSTWTLVNTGPARRVWGFFTRKTQTSPLEWTNWRKYLNCPNAETPREDYFR